MIKRILTTISLVSILSTNPVMAQNGNFPYLESGVNIIKYYLEYGLKLEKEKGKVLFYCYDLNLDGIPDHYWFDINEDGRIQKDEVYCDHDQDGIID